MIYTISIYWIISLLFLNIDSDLGYGPTLTRPDEAGGQDLAKFVTLVQLWLRNPAPVDEQNLVIIP